MDLLITIIIIIIIIIIMNDYYYYYYSEGKRKTVRGRGNSSFSEIFFKGKEM